MNPQQITQAAEELFVSQFQLNFTYFDSVNHLCSKLTIMRLCYKSDKILSNSLKNY